MKVFLIQTVQNKVVHDFAFGLIEAIKYHEWYYQKEIYEYVLSDTTDRPHMNHIQFYPLEDVIPVGTVDFVLEYLNRYYAINSIIPLNIPQSLMKADYLKRVVTNETYDSECMNLIGRPIFVKDNVKIKGYTELVKNRQSIPVGNYLVSEYVDIDSEWRAFIYKNQLVGLQNYAGDFTMFPDVVLINQMIEDVKHDNAYTLDVGINKNGTFIIECHDFFSCGLYGFADYNVLPKMFISTWNSLIK